MRIQIHIPWWVVPPVSALVVMFGLTQLVIWAPSPYPWPGLVAFAVLCSWVLSCRAALESGKEIGRQTDA